MQSHDEDGLTRHWVKHYTFALQDAEAALARAQENVRNAKANLAKAKQGKMNG